MKIAYFDCFAGAAGDMIVAAMIAAGLDADLLKSQLATLDLAGLEIKITPTRRASLKTLTFTPTAPKNQKHHHLSDITQIIQQSKISENAKKTAIAIFDQLAHAEAAVHGKSVDEIHFHEVGAVDSIVDIVSAAIGLEALGIEKVYSSPLSLGSGQVKCDHGILPVPAPATAELVKGVPVTAGLGEFEMLTPTAAAILTTVAENFGQMPAMKIETIGLGAGVKDPKAFPNILRLIIGQTADPDSETADSVCLLETNVDDVTGELIAPVTEKLLAASALDVFTTPIYMKHNRPAVKISVICKIRDIQPMERLLFEEGLTLGIRRQILQRTKLARRIVTVDTEFGRIRIKLGFFDGRVVSTKPEIADCQTAAKKHNVPVKTVIHAAIKAGSNLP